MSSESEHTVPASRKWTIALQPVAGEKPRKITKIIGLNGGGFSVLAPYHKARQGALHKLPVDPMVQGEQHVSLADCVNFVADDRVKLSYHTDGFAQFSGESPGKIISGRDQTTGEPKGLGLMTFPLKTPIWSGPSVGVTVWGIEEFDLCESADENLIVFEPDEIYFRGCTPEQANAWVIAIYAFPIDVVPPAQYVNGRPVVHVAFEPLSGRLVSVIRYKLLHLKDEKVFLGVYVNAFVGGFPAKTKSGWIISGPGDHKDGKKGHVLMGRYPRDDGELPDAYSLNYEAKGDPP